MKVTARLRHLNISPRKVRAVADTVRGLRAKEADGKLGTIRRRPALAVRKLLRSAIANAENSFGLDPQTLQIERLLVDGGPVLKRYRPRAQGRAALIEHRTSHVTVVLEGERALPAGRQDKTAAVKGVKGESKATDQIREKAEPAPKKEFEIEKKVGREQKPSFVKRLFRRKTV